jgi:hypothetical protein
MYKLPLVTLLLLSLPARFAFTQATAPCPTNAVFLVLENEIRGYSMRANGNAVPCQVLHGSSTTLSTARAISFTADNNLHVMQFLTNGTINIFAPGSSGDATPARTVTTYTNDLISIATDSRNTDYILSNRARPNPIVAVPDGATTPMDTFYDPSLAAAWSLAVDAQKSLLVAGYDSNGVATIDTYDTFDMYQHPTTPRRLRRLQGAATGLLHGDPTAYVGNTIAIAVDPVSQELYVYNTDADSTTIQISVFPPHAQGNVAPVRVIRGPATQIGIPGVVGTSKISVAADGRLFDAEPNNRILVFAPGATGNVTPSQIIRDATTGGAPIDQGGVAARFCNCCQ